MRIMLAGLLAAFLIVVGAAAYLQSLTPHTSQTQATAAAITQLRHQLGISEWNLVSARYDRAPDKIYDDRGNLIGSESFSSCTVVFIRLPGALCHAKPAWILHLFAPGEPNASGSDAYVVVNDQTGTVGSSSVVSR